MNAQLMNRAHAAGAAAPTAVYTCPVPHMPQAVAAVRHRAHGPLRTWGLPENTVDEALLVVSELVTNAVLHALPPAELRLLLLEDVVRIEVADSGTAPVRSGGTPAGGRGVVVIEALAVGYGADVRPKSVTHWVELRARPSVRPTSRLQCCRVSEGDSPNRCR
ncbi:ATP-binding protein [Microbispora sp. H10670]|uniref:ATP-binding protein n=1 Tax=Microbispora sp. H10670 TaxID=2729108 RepID=UPI001C7234ED|nr:ATP-binding protein [Microbispora sp. H10670]